MNSTFLNVSAVHQPSIEQPVIEQTSINTQWVDIRTIDLHEHLIDTYKAICQQHAIEKKWILVINPEDDSLAKLHCNNEVDTSRILKVNPNKKPVSLENIRSALCTGNCAAVILCQPMLANDELQLLQYYAQCGKTPCVVINKQHTVH